MKRKKIFLYIGFIVVMLSMTIGFSLIATNLDVTGDVTVKSQTWDLYFSNVRSSDDSKEASRLVIDVVNPTQVNYAVSLEHGEKFEFLVDANNQGTLTALIGSISNDLSDYSGNLSYSISYLNGSSVAIDQPLYVSNIETYKVTILYNGTDNGLINVDSNFNIKYTYGNVVDIDVNYSLVGTVYDINGVPLDGGYIVIDDISYNINSDGTYVINNLSAGEHIVEIKDLNNNLLKSDTFSIHKGSSNNIVDNIVTTSSYYGTIANVIVKENKLEITNVELSFEECQIGTVYEFEYTGDIQHLPISCTGTYKLEVWGAQGGSASTSKIGGKGGYSESLVELHKNDDLYIVVGGAGSCLKGGASEGGYNGGGDAFSRSSSYTQCSGGGATHVGNFNSTLAEHGNTNGLYIVAGGGGGAGLKSGGNSSSGGAGGGLTGIVISNDCSCGTRSGGSQTAGGTGRAGTGTFGKGAGSLTTGSCGGGGGLYGGGSDTYEWGAQGGSGYTVNGSTTAGNTLMPTYDGTSIMVGNEGNGYAKITYIAKPEKNKWYFKYTGNIQTFIAPETGTYKLEVWGAQGGAGNGTISSGTIGGAGGYSTGEINLTQGEYLYVVVGGKGLDHADNALGGYNGGGNGVASGAGGGGATHVSKTSTILSETGVSDLYIVAGAGGGGGMSFYASNLTFLATNAGGGLEGGTCSQIQQNGYSSYWDVGTGGTQTQGGGGYLRGQNNKNGGKPGAYGLGGSSTQGSGGGGGGYYGGGSGSYYNGALPGGGGSSYIAGVTNGETIDGNREVPTYDGASVMIGNKGNGYAKITLITN